MLLRYKKAHEKIAMGLLSYMPGEKSVKKLLETMQQYETDEHAQLYLLKDQDDFIGVVGIELEDDAYTVKHLSVNPSYRGEGIGTMMVTKLQELFPHLDCKSTEQTERFMKKCMKKEGAD
ncbi:GNAT family N-acetyltransferase [Sporosarcina sp. Te-1]|nr:GNAT family N-acetyltransferase [Sporosarcina sp. Te-1]QTD43309.1 GNAT family N-acetyltransferase [Sporosarcina sp. Te-1]